MADAGHGHDDAALAAVARHALHDEELIAGFAAGGLQPGPDTDKAQALIERCSVCRDLHRDLEAIGAALRVTAASTATAPRDFRLSVEDARRLGGRPTPRGFLAGLRRSILTFGRPVGGALATLGVVGLLVGSMSLGSPAAGRFAGDAGATTSAPGEIQQTNGGVPGPKSSDGSGQFGPASSPNSESVAPVMPLQRDAAASGPSLTGWLLIGSVTMLIAGLALLVLASRGRRGVPAPTQDR